MNNMILHRSTALVFILAAGTGLAAQELGSISGIIRDPAGKPVSGVLVTITAPTMLGVRNVTTNEQGRYTVPLLPVGNFRISISKTGYLGQRAENIRVGIGGTIAQNFTMRPVSTAAETVEITAGSEVGMVDKAETGAKFSFSAQQLSMLPVSRTFSGAAALSPGVVTGQSGQFNIRGGQGQQTQYRINGADVKDDYQGVVTGYGAIADNIEDTQLILSETHARYGRTLGGSINVTTKSGSNTFSGSFRTDFTRNTWRGTTPRNLYQGNVFNDDLIRDHTYTLNGPIWKDHIWFALSGVLSPTVSNVFNIQNIFQNVNTVMQSRPNTYTNAAMTSLGVTDPNDDVNKILNEGPSAAGIPGYAWSKFDAGALYTRTDKSGRHEFKITAMLIQNHTIDFGYTKETTSLLNRASTGDPTRSNQIARLGQLGDQESVNQVYNFGYKGVIRDNIFIEATYNKNDNVVHWPVAKEDITRNTELMWILAGIKGSTGGAKDNVIAFRNSSKIPSTRSNRSGNLNIKWIGDLFNINHEIDFGVDYYMGKLWEPSSNTSGYVFQIGGHYENPNAPLDKRFLFPALDFVGLGLNGQSATGTTGPAPWMRTFYGEEGMLESPTTNFYVNDKFIINEHFNGMIGFRFESAKMKDGTGRELGSSSFFSPRLQLRYDLNGDNAHLFTFTAARYGTDFNVRFMDSIAPKAADMNIARIWGGNGVVPYDASDPLGLYGVRFVDYMTLTDPANYPDKNIVSFGDTRLTRQVSELSTPYMDEYTLSYRRQLKNGSSMSITYANRAWYNDWALQTEWLPEYIVAIKDPSGAGLPNQYGQVTKYFNAGTDLKRDYQSLEMEFTARVNAYFTLQGNWTISRLTGNDESSDSTDTFAGYTSSKPYYHNYGVLSQAPYNATREELSPYGPLINDAPQRGRLFATLQLPLGKGYISLGWALNYDSGYPSSTTVDWALDLPGLPRPDGSAGTYTTGRPAYYTTYWNGRGWRRGNDNFSNNLRMSFAVPLGLKGWGLQRVQIMGDLDITNVFNARIYGDGYYADRWNPDNGYTLFYNYGSYRFGTANPAVGDYWRSTRSVGASLGLKF